MLCITAKIPLGRPRNKAGGKPLENPKTEEIIYGVKSFGVKGLLNVLKRLSRQWV
jgi:hypothetical protein